MTNESTPNPLRLDARTVLDSIVAGLSFVLAALAAVNLRDPYDILAPLLVGALIVVINRLLGRSSDAVVADLNKSVNAMIAQRNVLSADATTATRKQADAAAEAIKPGITKALDVAVEPSSPS